MPKFFDRMIAVLARAHAMRVYRRFEHAARNAGAAQAESLRRALDVVRGSKRAARLGLDRVRTPEDFRRIVPLSTFEDVREDIEAAAAGDGLAWHGPHTSIRMFASSSGTTSRPKWIPVTPEFIEEYRAGWNAFGVKVLSDHPHAFLRHILQGSGVDDAQRTPAGIPVGAITGLMAKMQKGIVRRYYIGTPAIARIEPSAARYYALMRFGLAHDVAFAITANPATLIQLARTANEHAEALIRDIHDGALRVPDAIAATNLPPLPPARPDPARARALEDIRRRTGRLRPADAWNLAFLGCWTGGSMSQYLERLRDWYGDLPVRDLGLLASEGRITIPVEDNVPAGLLDARSGFFEFIPAEEAEAPAPQTLLSHELEPGREYAIVLTNCTGLLRYRLNDVIRVHAQAHDPYLHSRAPLLEFRYRAGRVSSLAGEKLTEQHVVTALFTARTALGLPEFDYVLAPRWGDPPGYVLVHEAPLPADFSARLDQALADQNEEYESRRNSSRLIHLELSKVPPGSFRQADLRLLSARGGTAEQYKRPALLLDPADLEKWFPRA
jgi:hypothetical protein